jgi:hypothetical protein
MSRLRTLAPIIAIPILSLVNSVVVYILTSAGTGSIADPIGTFVPGAIYDGLLGLVAGPLIVSVHARRTQVERVDW